MYKILVTGLSSVAGGIESVIKNYYGCFDKTKIHMDFICNSPAKMAYEDYFVQNGSKVYHTARRGKNPLKYFKQLNDIFSQVGTKYNCLWFNTSDLANIDALKLAKKYNISRIIIHSHNSKMTEKGIKGLIKQLQHNHHKTNIEKYATDFWACSQVAAKWMYPKKLEDKITIIKNAINVDKYSYNKIASEKIKNKYKLKGYFILGNVGRLNFQKNQIFLLDVFEEIKKKIPQSKLILIGEGDDKEQLINKAKRLNIYNDVIFVGYQRNMAAWYSVFDIFAFPSLFEGLSVALLEAQANGVTIVSSDKVSKAEIRMNDNFYTLPLSLGPKIWANKIWKISKNATRINCETVYHNFKKNNYDIQTEAARVQNILGL